tara:strand:- start:940 stop:1197 length:258 start_codon:yes stop_codon:yes gene_type:complete
MIYFKKITPYQSEIILKHNCRTIGTLERLANAYYLVEVNYHPFELPVKYKKHVRGVVERVYLADIARKKRADKPPRPYTDFKIIE